MTLWQHYLTLDRYVHQLKNAKTKGKFIIIMAVIDKQNSK